MRNNLTTQWSRRTYSRGGTNHYPLKTRCCHREHPADGAARCPRKAKVRRGSPRCHPTRFPEFRGRSRRRRNEWTGAVGGQTRCQVGLISNATVHRKGEMPQVIVPDLPACSASLGPPHAWSCWCRVRRSPLRIKWVDGRRQCRSTGRLLCFIAGTTASRRSRASSESAPSPAVLSGPAARPGVSARPRVGGDCPCGR